MKYRQRNVKKSLFPLKYKYKILSLICCPLSPPIPFYLKENDLLSSSTAVLINTFSSNHQHQTENSVTAGQDLWQFFTNMYVIQ